MLRAYLVGIDPAVELPHRVTDGVMLRDASEAVSLGPQDELLRSVAAPTLKVVLDVDRPEERLEIVYTSTAVWAIRLASRCSLRVTGYMGSDAKLHEASDPETRWGHLDPEVTEEELDFVSQHFPVLLRYMAPEEFSRVGNALRLHNTALGTRSPDLALLGFVGALESLFSIAPQELSFRLSLLLGRFLGKNPVQQREFFDRARQVYRVRSKVAHGDRVERNEEQAAIQLAEVWTPDAEELSRVSLRCVFTNGLTETFDSKRRHEELLMRLLFEPNLEAALRGDGGRVAERDGGANFT